MPKITYERVKRFPYGKFSILLQTLPVNVIVKKKNIKIHLGASQDSSKTTNFRKQKVTELPPFQTSCYCRAELNSRIKFDLSTAIVQNVSNHPVRQAELSSARLLSTVGLAVPHGSSATWLQTACSCRAELNAWSAASSAVTLILAFKMVFSRTTFSDPRHD